MLPGPDLDAEIARKVFGVIVVHDSETGTYQVRDVENTKWLPLPPYSTDTVTAHQIVSRFKAAGCTFAIKNEDSSWSVVISHPSLPKISFGCGGQTLPHAICNSILQFNQLFKLTR